MSAPTIHPAKLMTSKTIGHGDEVDFDSAWNTLSSSLHEIHTKNASKLAFEQLYRNAYALVLKKRGELLYEKVRAFEQEWLASSVRSRVQAEINHKLIDDTHAQSASTVSERKVAGERLMRQLKQVWEDHLLSMNMFSDVLMYLVGSFLSLCIGEPGLTLCRTGFIAPIKRDQT